MTQKTIDNRPNSGSTVVEHKQLFSLRGKGNIIPKVDHLILDLLQEGQFGNIQPTGMYGLFSCSPDMHAEFSRIAARHDLIVEAAV